MRRRFFLSVTTATLLVGLPSLGAQTQHYAFFGDSADDRFGVSVAGAGDVNKDGFDDVIVGADLNDANGDRAGLARILSGADGSVLYTFYGDSANNYLGQSVAGVGDVDKDGYADVIVGAPGNGVMGTSSGMARVFSGADGSILHTFYGEVTNDNFGSSVAGAGDVNKDGFVDFIVGARGSDTNGFNSGNARVFSGADWSVLHTFYGDSIFDEFGFSVAGAGDFNNDGYADLIVGSPYDDDNGAESGSARVLSGADYSVLGVFYGDSPADGFGRSVAGAGDVNRDGFDDIIVGAFGDDDNGNEAGSARVLSGADSSVLWTFHGDSTLDYFGLAVAGAGDVDDDGFDDLVVGAHGDDTFGTKAGSASVFSGADGSVLQTFYGDDAGDYFGTSVAGAGDVDMDGYVDVIVGATLDEGRLGSARVFADFGCCPSVGFACTAAPCESCPEMWATTSGGVPELGNVDFALELLHAPANTTFAVLAIGGDRCADPGISYVFCENLRVYEPLVFLAAMPITSGVGPCGTRVVVPAPIPSEPAFIGYTVGVQWAISCDTTVLGTSISNCVSFSITN